MILFKYFILLLKSNMRAFILLLLLPAIVLAENTVQTSSLFDRLKTLAEKAITNSWLNWSFF